VTLGGTRYFTERSLNVLGLQNAEDDLVEFTIWETDFDPVTVEISEKPQQNGPGNNLFLLTVSETSLDSTNQLASINENNGTYDPYNSKFSTMSNLHSLKTIIKHIK